MKKRLSPKIPPQYSADERPALTLPTVVPVKLTPKGLVGVLNIEKEEYWQAVMAAREVKHG